MCSLGVCRARVSIVHPGINVQNFNARNFCSMPGCTIAVSLGFRDLKLRD